MTHVIVAPPVLPTLPVLMDGAPALAAIRPAMINNIVSDLLTKR